MGYDPYDPTWSCTRWGEAFYELAEKPMNRWAKDSARLELEEGTLFVRKADTSDTLTLNTHGITCICDTLQLNTFLTTLDLEYTKLGKEGERSISEALRTNTTLRTLVLTDCHLTADGANGLCDALKDNHTLTHLDISWNQLGRKATKGISKLIQRNDTMKVLDLSRNHIGYSNVGMEKLSVALKSNKSLRVLDLGDNRIENPGAKWLGRALKCNSGLDSLRLSGNDFTDKGALYIAKGLEFNSTLTTLNLTRCIHVRYSVMQLLGISLQKNPSLIRLEMDRVLSLRILAGLKRNQIARDTIHKSVLYWCAICKYSTTCRARILSNDVVKVIAKMVWSTRGQSCWIEGLQ